MYIYIYVGLLYTQRRESQSKVDLRARRRQKIVCRDYKSLWCREFDANEKFYTYIEKRQFVKEKRKKKKENKNFWDYINIKLISIKLINYLTYIIFQPVIKGMTAGVWAWRVFFSLLSLYLFSFSKLLVVLLLNVIKARSF